MSDKHHGCDDDLEYYIEPIFSVSNPKSQINK